MLLAEVRGHLRICDGESILTAAADEDALFWVGIELILGEVVNKGHLNSALNKQMGMPKN
jgi:hypothetical protein